MQVETSHLVLFFIRVVLIIVLRLFHIGLDDNSLAFSLAIGGGLAALLLVGLAIGHVVVRIFLLGGFDQLLQMGQVAGLLSSGGITGASVGLIVVVGLCSVHEIAQVLGLGVIAVFIIVITTDVNLLDELESGAWAAGRLAILLSDVLGGVNGSHGEADLSLSAIAFDWGNR